METLFAFDSVYSILFDLELECFCEIGAPKKPPFCYFPWKSLNCVPPMLSFKTEKEGPLLQMLKHWGRRRIYGGKINAEKSEVEE